MTTIVWKDGLPLAEVADDNEAFAFILRHQGQSVDYAMKCAGYSVHPQSNYGCGDDTCVSCYPFARNCPMCGESYGEPIPNVPERKLPSCDCGYEGDDDWEASE